MCVELARAWLGFLEGANCNQHGPRRGLPCCRVAGLQLAIALGANSKMILLPEETDGFPVAPAWLFWTRIKRTAVEFCEDVDMKEQPKL